MYLNCYSKATVKFAVQVLNKTTAKILQTFDTTATSQTTKFCQMLDQFFDSVNLRGLEKDQKKTNQFLKSYINENDEDSPEWQIISFHNLIHENKILKTGNSLKILDLKCLSGCKHIMANKLL